MNRRSLAIGAGAIVGTILACAGLIRVSELRNGPSFVGAFWFFLLTALTVLLLREFIHAHRGMRRHRVAYLVLLFILGIPILMQWYVEAGRSFLGAIWWLIPEFKRNRGQARFVD